jgi:TatD DNase family protein
MQRGAFTGVMHCFSSGAALAERALAVGFYISFSGILTFKKSTELQTIAANVPLDRILVETDSPYLAPTPHRGKPNEPAFTAYTLKKLAEIRGFSVAEMADITRRNTQNLFSKMVLS